MEDRHVLDGESFYDTNTSESLSSNSPENLPPENVAINLLAKSDSKDQDSAADSGPHFSPQAPPPLGAPPPPPPSPAAPHHQDALHLVSSAPPPLGAPPPPPPSPAAPHHHAVFHPEQVRLVVDSFEEKNNPETSLPPNSEESPHYDHIPKERPHCFHQQQLQYSKTEVTPGSQHVFSDVNEQPETHLQHVQGTGRNQSVQHLCQGKGIVLQTDHNHPLATNPKVADESSFQEPIMRNTARTSVESMMKPEDYPPVKNLDEQLLTSSVSDRSVSQQIEHCSNHQPNNSFGRQRGSDGQETSLPDHTDDRSRNSGSTRSTGSSLDLRSSGRERAELNARNHEHKDNPTSSGSRNSHDSSSTQSHGQLPDPLVPNQKNAQPQVHQGRISYQQYAYQQNGGEGSGAFIVHYEDEGEETHVNQRLGTSGDSNLAPNVGLTNSYDNALWGLAPHEFLRSLQIADAVASLLSLVIALLSWLGKLVFGQLDKVVLLAYLAAFSFILLSVETVATFTPAQQRLIPNNFMGRIRDQMGFLFYPWGKAFFVLLLTTMCWAIGGTLLSLIGSAFFVSAFGWFYASCAYQEDLSQLMGSIDETYRAEARRRNIPDPQFSISNWNALMTNHGEVARSSSADLFASPFSPMLSVKEEGTGEVDVTERTSLLW